MKVFSCDAEVNGLYGHSFAIAAIVREDGVEVARFEGRVGDEYVSNPWVIENVLPALQGMPVTHESPEALEEAFWAFWMEHREGAEAIAQFGSPVESGLFRRCVERNLDERAFQGPYPLHEVGTALLLAGEVADSVDAYLEKYDVEKPAGSPHHPGYDAECAAWAWEMLR
jgi:hypothetical protein